MKHLLIVIFILGISGSYFSQTDSVKKKEFNPKEEIAFDGKRYRVYNNWLTAGVGAGYNSKWPKDEKNIGFDYSFHIKQYYFRVGGFMSGANFGQSNNYNAHAGIGLRKETSKYNLSAFVGPSTSFFRRALKDSTTYNLNTVYNEVGGYACLEAIYKLKYDVGVGGQIFCDYNRVQMVYGVRLVFYFSGAYRGIKYGYRNPSKTKK